MYQIYSNICSYIVEKKIITLLKIFFFKHYIWRSRIFNIDLALQVSEGQNNHDILTIRI